MKRTADHAAIRQKLLDATVAVVAEEGIEGCTSKKIAAASGLNEAYIFRYYFDMKDLKKSAFFREEEHIFSVLRDALVGYRKTLKPEETKKAVFSDLWALLLESKQRTMFFLRFFLSTECKDDVLDTHLDNCARYFLPDEEEAEADKKARFGSAHLLTVCQYAAFVHCHLLDDSEELKNRIFNHLI